MSTITFFRGHEHAGKSRTTPSGVVQYVDCTADIRFQKYTKDGAYAQRPFVVTSTGRRYATLSAAAAAVIKAK